jgi:hypothetical protein
VDAGIRDKTSIIEELAERISSIRVSTPPRRRESTPKSPSVDTKPAPLSSFSPSLEIVELAERRTARQAKLKAQLLARKGTTARVTHLDVDVRPKGGLAHTALVNGPIDIESVPIPGTTKIEVKKEVKEEPALIAEQTGVSNGPSNPPPVATATAQSSLFALPVASQASQTPTSPVPATGGMFGAIKFGALDPGPITPTSATARKNNASGGSSRAHSAAPKFGGGSGLGTSPVSPGVSFVPPAQDGNKPAGNKNSPSGFFR